MQYLTKKNVFTFVIATLIATLILLAFVSLLTTNNITNVSAVEANEVGVYWDSNCTKGVSSINWGNLTPGSAKSFLVYIRNEVENPIYLTMLMTNWNPTEASNYITLRWNYAGQPIDPSEVLQIKLVLFISSYIKGISNFSFDIFITGSQNLLGDINGDGKVGLADVGKLDLIYSGLITDPELVARGDIDGNGKIDLADVAKLELIISGVL